MGEGCRILLLGSRRVFENTTRRLRDSVDARIVPERAAIWRQKIWWPSFTAWDLKPESTWKNCWTPLNLPSSFHRGRTKGICCVRTARELAESPPRREVRHLSDNPFLKGFHVTTVEWDSRSGCNQRPGRALLRLSIGAAGRGSHQN